MKLLDKFKFLPDEIKGIIINYTDIIVYRYGKYINRVIKNDKKYSILYTIPRPISMPNDNKIILRLIKYNCGDASGYIITYFYREDYIIINIVFVVREVDGFDRYYDKKSDTNLLIKYV